MAVTSFAGTWKTGAAPNENRWWYDDGSGNFVSNGWQWIDDDNDGIAECYYFDENGWALMGTTTPDGCTVNENGAWIQDGIVMTKKVSQTADKTDSKTGTERLRSVLVMEKGRPLIIGVPFGVYTSGQLTSEIWDITTDSTPAEVRDEAGGYIREYDDRGFLVKKYHFPRGGVMGLDPETNTFVAMDGPAFSADYYQYSDDGKLLTSWTFTSTDSKDASKVEPTMNDTHREYVYDTAGRLTKEIYVPSHQGAKTTTYYYYDSYGRLIKTIQDFSERSKLDYGVLTLGWLYETRYTYNDAAKTITKESETTKYEVDEAGNKYGMKLSRTTYYCDEAGRIIKDSDSTGYATYVYDNENRVTRKENYMNGSLWACTEYVYN